MIINGETLTIFGIKDICRGPFLVSCLLCFNMANVGHSLYSAIKANKNEAVFKRRHTSLTFIANLSFMVVLLGVWMVYT